MTSLPQDHELRRWFAGLVETSFHEQVGLCDPSLLDYVTDLLTEFIHIERINLLGDGSGRRIEDVAEMLAEAEVGPLAASEDRRRRVHQHIGDFTLFWTGIYPENLRRMRRRSARDDLLNYLEQGKRSYAIASDLSTDNTQPPALLLSTLSEQFEYCVYGLGLVRKEWERSDPGGFGSMRILWG